MHIPIPVGIPDSVVIDVDVVNVTAEGRRFLDIYPRKKRVVAEKGDVVEFRTNYDMDDFIRTVIRWKTTDDDLIRDVFQAIKDVGR